MNINIFEIVRVLLELRIYFQDDVVLIQLREDRGHEALAVSIVERVVDIGRKNSQARCGVAINGQHGDQPIILLIARDVSQFGERPELIHEARHPMSQFFRVHVFQAVLKLRAADAIFDGEVLHRLHEERDAVDISELGLKAPDNVGGGNLALLERLEINLDPAAVQRGIDAVNPDEGGKAGDRGIFQNNVGQCALTFGHGRERHILRTFGDTEDYAGILYREKPFRYIDVQKNRAYEGGGGHEQGSRAEAQHKSQRTTVKGDDGIKSVFGFPIEPTLVLFPLMAQQLGGHHRGEGEGDEGRNDDGDGKCHGKFAEQAPYDVPHEEQRNEHGDQRDGQRQNREADLLGTFERGLQWGLALFDIAGNVFDHDDSVVDHEAGGNSERHQ